jgi:hypothetical protein
MPYCAHSITICSGNRMIPALTVLYGSAPCQIAGILSSLAKASREALCQAITAKTLDDRGDKNAGLGSEQCSSGVID